MINVRVKEVVKYGGHSLSANGSVNFTLKAGYSELPSSIKLMQLLNNDVYIKAKTPGERPMKLGEFRVKQIVIDSDGESVLKFNGLNDYIEMDNLNLLPMNDSDIKEFVVMMEADIEEENDESEDEDDGEE